MFEKRKKNQKSKKARKTRKLNDNQTKKRETVEVRTASYPAPVAHSFAFSKRFYVLIYLKSFFCCYFSAILVYADDYCQNIEKNLDFIFDQSTNPNDRRVIFNDNSGQKIGQTVQKIYYFEGNTV